MLSPRGQRGWTLSYMNKPAGVLGAGWGATTTTLSHFFPPLNEEVVPIRLNTCLHGEVPTGSLAWHPEAED